MKMRALIIIDLQNDYFPGGKWALDGIDAAAGNAVRVLASSRAKSEVVVHVRHEFLTDDAPFFIAGSEGAKINPSVAPIEGEPVVLKHYANAFRDTELKLLLDENGVEEITLVGAMSHLCVDATTRAASDFGYTVTVVHDACASRSVEFGGTTVSATNVHAAFMAPLGFAYAKLVSTQEALAPA